MASQKLPETATAAQNAARVDLKSLDRAGLAAFMAGMGKERYRAAQVYKWLWQRGVTSFQDMTNIARETRDALGEVANITWLEQTDRLRSADGTQKFLWRTHDGHAIESVLIPDDDGPARPRLTLCVSTQVGCAMACSFCLTGDLGLKRNLTAAEIANQPLQVSQQLDPDQRITNLVFMGMGEPLHNYDNLIVALRNLLDDEGQNYSHRRLTVSTVGLVPAMQRLASELPVNLAVSLNATTEEQRRQVMPLTRRHSLDELMQCCRTLPLPPGKRITFEYVMMAGFNDSLDDARRLVRLMHGVKNKVNLIPYNENPDRDIRRPSAETVKAFQHYLVNRGIQASVRTTRGIDIAAACGQLGKVDEARARRAALRDRTPNTPSP